MTALIVAFAAVVHVACALTTARLAYGRFRLWQVAHPPAVYDLWSVGGRCALAAAGLTAGCLAGLWPAVVAVAAVMAAPPKTPGETAAELKAQSRRVAELERELGLKP